MTRVPLLSSEEALEEYLRLAREGNPHRKRDRDRMRLCYWRYIMKDLPAPKKRGKA